MQQVMDEEQITSVHMVNVPQMTRILSIPDWQIYPYLQVGDITDARKVVINGHYSWIAPYESVSAFKEVLEGSRWHPAHTHRERYEQKLLEYKSLYAQHQELQATAAAQDRQMEEMREHIRQLHDNEAADRELAAQDKRNALMIQNAAHQQEIANILEERDTLYASNVHLMAEYDLVVTREKGLLARITEVDEELAEKRDAYDELLDAQEALKIAHQTNETLVAERDRWKSRYERLRALDQEE